MNDYKLLGRNIFLLCTDNRIYSAIKIHFVILIIDLSGSEEELDTM